MVVLSNMGAFMGIQIKTADNRIYYQCHNPFVKMRYTHKKKAIESKYQGLAADNTLLWSPLLSADDITPWPLPHPFPLLMTSHHCHFLNILLILKVLHSFVVQTWLRSIVQRWFRDTCTVLQFLNGYIYANCNSWECIKDNQIVIKITVTSDYRRQNYRNTWDDRPGDGRDVKNELMKFNHRII